MRILLVEDDRSLASVLERGLSSQGRQVVVVDTGEDALAVVDAEPVDVVLLDIRLPGMDGRATLSAIRRARPALPVIMITARDDLESKIGSLDAGADDYLVKPFAFDELLARIRAVTRRSDQPSATVLAWADLRIDLLAHRAARAGESIALTRREFQVLEYFARNPHSVLSRQQVLLAVWEYDYEGDTNIVDVYVRALRSKLDLPGQPSLFSTVRGSGYRFDPPAA